MYDGERGPTVVQPERISPNGEIRDPRKKTYRPDSEGVREWDPKPRKSGVIVLTERVSPSIRSAVGWLYPLEHYDQRLRLDPVSQYAELLLIIGSGETVDTDSVRAVLQEARGRLSDQEFERLQGYVDLLMIARENPPGPG